MIRTIIFSVKSPNEATTFLEYIKKRLKRNFKVNIKHKKLIINIKGTPDEVKALSEEIKELYKDWRAASELKKGVYKYNIGMILLLANIKVGIPLSLICDILRFMGYKVWIEEKGTLCTDMNKSDLIKLVKKIGRKYKEACLTPSLTSSAKKIVTIVNVMYEIELEKSINLLKERGILRQSNNKITLAVNYDKALSVLSELFKKYS